MMDCPKCRVPMHQMLFMGVQPDGWVCPVCKTYHSDEGRPLALVLEAEDDDDDDDETGRI